MKRVSDFCSSHVAPGFRRRADGSVAQMHAIGYKCGFPLAFLNALGAATATAISYSIAFPGAAGYILAGVMGTKTAFVNILIGYALFKKSTTHSLFAEDKGTEAHLENDSAPLSPTRIVHTRTHTLSTDILFTVSILSALTDLLTNFIATKTTFESLGNTLMSREETMFTPAFFIGMGVFFAVFASLQSIFQSTKFMFNVWDRAVSSEPRDRFKRWVHSSPCCFYSCHLRKRTYTNAYLGPDDQLKYSSVLATNPTSR